MHMKPNPCIPGLVHQCFIEGSRHKYPVPNLVHSKIENDNCFDFQWTATGTSTYTITAKGKIKILEWNDENPIFDKNTLNVRCSCPDGDRQNTAYLDSSVKDKIRVCKHAAAALKSVIDKKAVSNLTKNAEIYLKEEAIVKNQQEQQHPGERERIEHGLSKRRTEEVLDLLHKKLKTAEGLKALIEIFPSDTMPVKIISKCGRCKKEYDPQVVSDRVCRVKHPEDQVETHWDGSKRSWEECDKCGKTFNLDGFPIWGKYDPVEQGEYCSVDEHVPEEDIKEEDE